MADDKQNDDPMPDPWGDLLSDGPGEPAPEFSFSFDEPAEAPAAEPDFPAAEAEPEAPADVPAAEVAAERQLDDDLVGSWLDEGEAVGEDAAAAVEPAEATAGSSSSIEIGTGRSGIVESDEVDAWDDVGSADDQPSGDAATSGDTFSFDDPAPAEAAAEEAVPFVADEGNAEEPAFPGLDNGVEDAAVGLAGAAVATATAPARKAGKAAKPAKAKAGGIGQIIGLLLGGAMAFPIVFGILVGLMWAGVNVPVGRSIGRALPESVAFIVPEKFRPGYKKPALGGGTDGAGKGSPLDALGTTAPSGDGETSPAPGTGGTNLPDVPMDESGEKEPGEPLVDDAPVEPGDGETFEDPLAAATEPAVKPAAPSPLDTLRAKAEFERAAAEAAAEAARAERKPLDAAVEQALVAVTALEEVADPEDPARKKLLVDLYKALATVGAELAILERISADAGRPLTAAPESLDGLHGRLGAHRDDLVRLGRNWLDFTKRPSDGVVLPVTFQSSRKIGPYWASKVTLPQAKEGVRELVVLSRTEPAAVAGDEVVVTGMVFDGGVVWAADVRQPGRAGGGGFF